MKTHIIDGQARGKIIAAINHQIIRGEQGCAIIIIQSLLVNMAFKMRVQRAQRVGHGLGLILPQHIIGKQNLPLQIGQSDSVIINQPQRADTGSRQILRHRMAQTAQTDQCDARRFQFLLTGTADFLQHNMALIAGNLSLGQRRHRAYSPSNRAVDR